MPSKKRKSRKPAKPWAMFPSLDEDVQDLLQEENLEYFFYNNGTDESFIKQRKSCIMGRFICNNSQCTTQGWGSKKIAVGIRVYDGRRYSAIVFKQMCRECNMACRPIPDGTYAERIAYWLKKWSGVSVSQPAFKKGARKPHRNDLCMGCIAGYCEGF